MPIDDSRLQIPLFESHETNNKPEPPKPAPRSKESKTSAKAAAAPTILKKGSVGASNAGISKKLNVNRNKETVKNKFAGNVPDGDVRLTANIREDLHLKLKIAAARNRTTIGELIEMLVEKYI